MKKYYCPSCQKEIDETDTMEYECGSETYKGCRHCNAAVHLVDKSKELVLSHIKPSPTNKQLCTECKHFRIVCFSPTLPIVSCDHSSKSLSVNIDIFQIGSSAKAIAELNENAAGCELFEQYKEESTSLGLFHATKDTVICDPDGMLEDDGEINDEEVVSSSAPTMEETKYHCYACRRDIYSTDTKHIEYGEGSILVCCYCNSEVSILDSAFQAACGSVLTDLEQKRLDLTRRLLRTDNIPPIPSVKPIISEKPKNQTFLVTGEDSKGELVTEIATLDGDKSVILKKIVRPPLNFVYAGEPMDPSGVIEFNVQYDPGGYFSDTKEDFTRRDEFLKEIEELNKKYGLATEAYYTEIMSISSNHMSELGDALKLRNAKDAVINEIMNLLYEYFPYMVEEMPNANKD